MASSDAATPKRQLLFAASTPIFPGMATQPEIPPVTEPSYDPAPDIGPGITPHDPGVIETPPPFEPYPESEPHPEARGGFVKPAYWSNEPAPLPAAGDGAADPDGLSPTRYGDWTKNGIAIDF